MSETELKELKEKVQLILRFLQTAYPDFHQFSLYDNAYRNAFYGLPDGESRDIQCTYSDQLKKKMKDCTIIKSDK